MQATATPGETEEFYAAVSRRDRTYAGRFWVGVRTTGIFCRPGCPARTPKREHVEFFPRAADALAAGYRPCRKCRPLEPEGTDPEWAVKLLAAVEADPRRRWTEQDLRDFGVEPNRVRRWCQDRYGITFLAYLRARRLGLAFARLRDGEPVADTAFEHGYDSVSGFVEALGVRATRAGREGRGGDHPRLRVRELASPLGPMVAAADEDHLYVLEFWDRRMLETQFDLLAKRWGASLERGTNAILDQVEGEVEGWFAGRVRTWSVPCRHPGSEHQMQVWKTLREVPYGSTWSYAELAAACGKPKAVRSVARAVGENRLAIILPCHRIVGANGQLTGYGGGLWRKKYLLDLERKNLG